MAATTHGISRMGFAIQMGAFSDIKNAERFTTRLQAKGLDAFYFRKDNGLYAVRFGNYPSKNKALAVAKRLVADRLITAFYIAPPHEIVFSKPQGPGWQKAPPEEIKAPPEVKHTVKVQLPAVDEKPLHKPHTRSDKDMGAIAARTAERFVGIPYRWGGENVVDGMDCSGFVRAVYNLCGLSIPRTARDQFKTGDPIAREDLRDGDLVFFGSSENAINHVGIYVGGNRFVHAPKRGEEIRASSIDDSYFDKRFIGGRRYFQ
ncbi:MAG: NlpC/P60 family protein [Geobacteraceae bacterium]|nr:NlpC/P60 family protein [Geobacteraceae bacterium]